MREGMVEIVLDGPGKNSMGTEMMTWLRSELSRADGAPVLLRGVNGALSAGLDVKEVAGKDAADIATFIQLLEDLVDDFYNYPGPTVAQIDGHAIAGGCVLGLCCDHRVVKNDPKIRIGLNEVALGLQFPLKVLRMVHHSLGQRRAEHAILGAGLHAPEQAVALGLADVVADNAGKVARDQLDALASHPPEQYRIAKKHLRSGALDVTDAERDRWSTEELPSWTSPDLKARLKKLLER